MARLHSSTPCSWLIFVKERSLDLICFLLTFPFFVLQKIHSGGVVQSQRVSLEEGDVRLDLNVLDLPGFGDDIDNSRYSFTII